MKHSNGQGNGMLTWKRVGVFLGIGVATAILLALFDWGQSKNWGMVEMPEAGDEGGAA